MTFRAQRFDVDETRAVDTVFQAELRLAGGNATGKLLSKVRSRLRVDAIDGNVPTAFTIAYDLAEVSLSVPDAYGEVAHHVRPFPYQHQRYALHRDAETGSWSAERLAGRAHPDELEAVLAQAWPAIQGLRFGDVLPSFGVQPDRTLSLDPDMVSQLFGTQGASVTGFDVTLHDFAVRDGRELAIFEHRYVYSGPSPLVGMGVEAIPEGRLIVDAVTGALVEEQLRGNLTVLGEIGSVEVRGSGTFTATRSFTVVEPGALDFPLENPEQPDAPPTDPSLPPVRPAPVLPAHTPVATPRATLGAPPTDPDARPAPSPPPAQDAPKRPGRGAPPTGAGL